MRLGVVYPQTELMGGDPAEVHELGVGVEDLGFDHLLGYDHVVGLGLETAVDHFEYLHPVKERLDARLGGRE